MSPTFLSGGHASFFQYPVIALSTWACATLHVPCQVAVGIVLPVEGLLTKVPMPALVDVAIIGLTSAAFRPNFPIVEVVRYVLPSVGSLVDHLHGRRYQPWSLERSIIWALSGLISLCCCLCACGDMISRIYPERKPHPQLLSHLKMPLASDDSDKTSGSSSDREILEWSWAGARSMGGLFASTCNAHCVLINGDQNNRLPKKTCKRPGPRCPPLLSSDELYSIG